jgi:hypothetical protein
MLSPSVAATQTISQDGHTIETALSWDHPVYPTNAQETSPMSTMNANRTKLTRNKSDQRRAIHHASRHAGGWQ